MKTIRNLIFDPEYQLNELLKAKLSLRQQIIDEKDTGGNFKRLFKCFLASKNIVFLLKKDKQAIIETINHILTKKFNRFKEKEESITILPFTRFYKNDFPNFFDQLIIYNEQLEKYGSCLIIQGSYADHTATGYSDVDLVIIGGLCAEVVVIKKEIEDFLISIDPLQHHGVFFIDKKDFDHYWQMQLPLATLKKSLSFSDEPLELDVKFTFKETLSANRWIYNFMSTHKVSPLKNDTEVFFAKNFLSQFMLIPVLYLATKGEYIYKKDSFEMIKSRYSKAAWRCMEMATQIREVWSQEIVNDDYKKNRNNISSKSVGNFGNISDVVKNSSDYLILFNEHYPIFIAETKDILNAK